MLLPTYTTTTTWRIMVCPTPCSLPVKKKTGTSSTALEPFGSGRVATDLPVIADDGTQCHPPAHAHPWLFGSQSRGLFVSPWSFCPLSEQALRLSRLMFLSDPAASTSHSIAYRNCPGSSHHRTAVKPTSAQCWLLSFTAVRHSASRLPADTSYLMRL